MGFQLPFMPQQNANGPAAPFPPFHPQQGMGFQPPFMPQQNVNGPAAQTQQQNMGGQQNLNMGQIMDLLSMLFNASTYPSFYEE
jgi:hypothetical protein